MKIIIISFNILSFFLFSSLAIAQTKETTLVSYYPSPTGSYKQLRISDSLIIDNKDAIGADAVCNSLQGDVAGGARTGLVLLNGRLGSCSSSGKYQRNGISELDEAAYGSGVQVYPLFSSATGSSYYFNLDKAGALNATPVMSGIGFESSLVKIKSNDIDSVVIDNNGHVGIGGAPASGERLNVAGAIKANGVLTVVGVTSSGDVTIGNASIKAGNGDISTPGKLTAAGVISTGNIAVGAKVIVDTVGNVAAASVTSTGDVTVGSASINAATGNIQTSGNLQAARIGVNKPPSTQAVDVQGNIMASGNIASQGNLLAKGVILGDGTVDNCKTTPGCMWIDPTVP